MARAQAVAVVALVVCTLVLCNTLYYARGRLWRAPHREDVRGVVDGANGTRTRGGNGTGDSVNVVVFSPHMDDAVFSAYSALWRRGRSVEVVTVFGGKPAPPLTTSWDRTCGFGDSDAAHAARLLEDGAALGQTATRAAHWPLLDGQYRSAADSAGLHDRIKSDVIRHVLARARSNSSGNEGVLAVLFPALTRHHDHRALHAAVAEAACDAGLREALAGGGHRRVEWWAYEDLPYVMRWRSSVPQFVESIDRRAYDTFVQPLDAAAWEGKRAAIAAYRSQRQLFNADTERWSRRRCGSIGVSLPEGAQSTAVACEVFYRMASCEPRKSGKAGENPQSPSTFPPVTAP
eukprot:m51a1_g7153 hypothetical protein (347) ;mRNA; f:339666-341034